MKCTIIFAFIVQVLSHIFLMNFCLFVFVWWSMYVLDVIVCLLSVTVYLFNVLFICWTSLLIWWTSLFIWWTSLSFELRYSLNELERLCINYVILSSEPHCSFFMSAALLDFALWIVPAVTVQIYGRGGWTWRDGISNHEQYHSASSRTGQWVHAKGRSV